MTLFPVTSSILSATHLDAFLQEKYDLSDDTTCSLVRAGINHTYLVADHGIKYVFRVYSLNWRTQTEITEEIRLLNELKQNNVPVSYPVADKNDNYIQTLNAPEGERFGILFSFAAGEKLHLIPAETHFRIGALMAQIHSVTQNMRLDRVQYTPQVLLQEPMGQLAKFLPEDTDEMGFMRTTQEHLLEIIAAASTSHIRSGVVHLDMWFDNLNVAADNQVIVFDFDFCGNGWLCLDLAYYMMQLHNVEKYEVKDYQPKVDSFLAGYESVSAISDEEKRLLPALGVSLYFFYLGIQCRRYDNWSNTFLNENYLKRFINGLVKRYYDIYSPGK